MTSSIPKKIVVLGAGISGLTLAYRLSKLSLFKTGQLEISVYDKAPQIGGVIQTELTDGWVLEAGPDSFISEKPAALELCRELGIESRVIPTRSEYRKSYIVSRGKLFPIPEGFYLMAPSSFSALWRTPLLSLVAKLRMGLEVLIPKRKSNEDESLADFVCRRFGKEALDRLAQPLISGIYSAAPEKLSLQATFRQFQEMEKEYGSVIRALAFKKKIKSAGLKQASGPRYSLFLSFQTGISELVLNLDEKLKGVRLNLNQNAISLKPSEGKWQVQFEDGSLVKADAVCLALSTPVAARLLSNANTELAKLLESIKYASVATVNFGFKADQIKRPFLGAGFVIPASENKKTIGCTFSHLKYSGRAPEGYALLRAFARVDHEVSNPDELAEELLNEIAPLLQIEGRPIFHSVKVWNQSMPQYWVGHQTKVLKINEAAKKSPGLFLTGNAYEGIGIPDCIQHATKISAQITEFFDK